MPVLVRNTEGDRVGVMPARTPDGVRGPALAQAKALMDAGSTMRQASEAVAVPYTTLRDWLASDGRVTTRPWKHRVTQIDVISRTGACAECGLTAIRMTPPGSGKWICTQGERLRRLKREYGLEPEEALALWEAQQGLCEGCDIFMEMPCVDHDHKTGKVRGLLCSLCNRGSGLLGDDPSRMRKLADYFERNK